MIMIIMMMIVIIIVMIIMIIMMMMIVIIIVIYPGAIYVGSIYRLPGQNTAACVTSENWSSS